MNPIEMLNKMLSEVKQFFTNPAPPRIGEIQHVDIKLCSDCKHGDLRCMPFGCHANFIDIYWVCTKKKKCVECLEAEECESYENKYQNKQI